MWHRETYSPGGRICVLLGVLFSSIPLGWTASELNTTFTLLPLALLLR